MTSLRWILGKIGKIYKHAHDLAMKTNHPDAKEILNLCNKLAEQYTALKKREKEDPE